MTKSRKYKFINWLTRGMLDRYLSTAVNHLKMIKQQADEGTEWGFSTVEEYKADMVVFARWSEKAIKNIERAFEI